MSIDLALEIAQHNAVTADLPEAGEFGRIADLLKAEIDDRSDCVAWQFYQDGKWHMGLDNCSHRRETEAAGYPIRLLYLAAERNQPATSWKPISTVPPDVDEILAADADGDRFVAWFDDGEWRSCEGFVPTQWIALPEVQS